MTGKIPGRACRSRCLEEFANAKVASDLSHHNRRRACHQRRSILLNAVFDPVSIDRPAWARVGKGGGHGDQGGGDKGSDKGDKRGDKSDKGGNNDGPPNGGCPSSEQSGRFEAVPTGGFGASLMSV